MFRIALTVVVALGLAFGQGPQRGVARPPTPALAAAAGSYYALIVGIDDYATLTKLKTAVNDARSMEAALRDLYGFQRPDLLIDREATRAGILDAMERYRGVLHEADSLLIYFAGHGQMDREENRAYWLPVDAGRTQSSWISADDIAAAVRAMPSRHVLVISDSCYSGDLAGTTRAPNFAANSADHSSYLQKMIGAKSRTFIASGGDEPVADGGANGHSVFTGAVLTGLRALEGNAFSAENLFQWYVREQVGGGSTQTPHFDYMRASGHVDGDFVFVSGVAAGVKAAPVLVPDPGPAAAAAQAENVYWSTTDKGDAESLRLYLHRYPNGQFADLAERYLTRLAVPAVPPANPASANPAPTLRAGQTKLNQKDGLRYVWIPAGTFQIGCSAGDTECFDDEKPAHSVTISKGFYMGQTSVTVAAWKRYQAAGGPALGTADSLGRKLNEAAGNDSVPAVAMTWDEAKNYCEWADMRLPTEAEWELAARAGTTASRYGTIDDVAWYGDNGGQKRIDSTAIWNSAQANYDKRLFANGNGPKPVGQKRPNAYGLYDILGNVWNWTADWYDEKYYQRRESQDPTGPPAGTERALRGGSWRNQPQSVRVSNRGWSELNVRDNDNGLRCVGK